MDAHKETLGSYNWYEGEICTKKRKSVSVVKRREGRDVWAHFRTIEEKVY